MKYISKKDEWFDEGTEAKIVVGPYGQKEHGLQALFEGIRNGEVDQEVCLLEEFEIIEETND